MQDLIAVRDRSFARSGAMYGRMFFGASSVAFGVIALMWHDADTWQQLFIIWSLPFGVIIGECLAIAQIAGGVGMLYPRTARPASIVLAIVYGLFSIAGIPGIVASPAVYQEYGSFFEQFALLCGAVAAYAAINANAATLGRAARIGLGLSAASFMLDQAFYLRETAHLVPMWIPPNQLFWAILTTIAFGLAALALLVNLQSRLASRMMTVMVVLFGVLVWIPRLIARPQSHGNWSEFILTFLIAAAAWVVADVLPVPLRGTAR